MLQPVISSPLSILKSHFLCFSCNCMSLIWTLSIFSQWYFSNIMGCSIFFKQLKNNDNGWVWKESAESLRCTSETNRIFYISCTSKKVFEQIKKKNEYSDHWCHLLVAVGPKTICSGKKLTLCLLKFIGWKLVRRAILIYMAKRIIDATFAAWSLWERNPIYTNRGKMAALDFSQQTNSPLKSLNQLQSASTASLMIWVLFLTWFV